MRTLFLAAILIGMALDSFAQGRLIFINNAATAITNGATGLPAAGGPVQDDTFVGLYIGNVGDSAFSLTLVGAATNCFMPGRFNGGIVRLAGRFGPVMVQVRAWLAATVYPSYKAAAAGAFAGDDSVLAGVSDPFVVYLTEDVVPAPALGDSGLTPIVLLPVIPEPSTIALGLLGLACLVLLRRRK